MAERTCIGCGHVFDKANLLRLVVRDGFLEIDPAGVREGRGAYLCPRRLCIEGAFKKKGAFSRAFRRRVTVQSPDKLLFEIKKKAQEFKSE